jgi:C4-dicarboxylate transporter DctM subunit
MSDIGLALLLMFLGGLGLGIPIAVAMGLACVAILIWQGLPIVMLAQQMVNSAQSFTFIAIPAYLLLGSLMGRSGLVERLIDFCMAVIGWVRGGLSLVAILASMIFAGISGSGSADTAAVGSVMIPALKKTNYGAGYAAAVLAAGGSIGIIIPPSIPMIVYGLATNTSIPALFLAGYVPGLLLGGGFMIYCYFVARRRGLGIVQEFNTVSLGRAFRRAFLALLAPVIIIGSVVSAIVTPSESAIFGVAYILFLGFVVYRTLTPNDLIAAFLEAASLSAVIMFIVMTSTMFGWIIARENIPESLVQAVLSVTSSKVIILLSLNAVLLIAGMLMDTIAVLIILVPIVLPVAVALGMDPVHFGVMFVFNMAIGLLTPPVGYCLFISGAIAQVSLGEVIRAIWAFVWISIAVLLLVTFAEPVTMFIPKLFYGG